MLSMLSKLSNLFTLFHKSGRSPIPLLFILMRVLQNLRLLLGKFYKKLPVSQYDLKISTVSAYKKITYIQQFQVSYRKFSWPTSSSYLLLHLFRPLTAPIRKFHFGLYRGAYRPDLS